MKKIEIGSEEWKEKRLSLITATDARVIMGVDPWTTPLQLFHRKLTGEEPKKNDAMERGNRLESEALRLFNEKMGLNLKPEFVCEGTEYFCKWMPHWIAASFDGIGRKGRPEENRFVACEIKCPGKESHELAKKGIIPDIYVPQLVHQCCVSPLEDMYYVSYRPQDDEPFIIIYYCIPANYPMDKLLEKEAEFFKNLNNFIPPEPTQRDMQVIVDDQDFFDAEQRLKLTIDSIKFLEKQEEELRRMLIEKCKNRSTQGKHLRLSPSLCKGAIDYSQIPELQNVDKEKYRKKPFTKWRIDSL